MNIPARYCTGHLSDIGEPPPYGAMDFAGWFEAYLDGRWYIFDARNNTPRIRRVLIARGRDAAGLPRQAVCNSRVGTGQPGRLDVPGAPEEILPAPNARVSTARYVRQQTDGAGDSS